MSDLFSPIQLGQQQLNNRIFMAPLTRGRAGEKGIPGELMAEYYAQRASAGLIIAEATATSHNGRGWLNSPGLFNDEQQAGWQRVADAVHTAGGKIFVQLWHMGASVHPDFLLDEEPVSSSAVKLTGTLPTPLGRDRPFTTPKALSRYEISQQVKYFAQAARRAVDAGLDGVEIHAANGFLIDQFTRDSSNQRSDEYGGSVDNRLRFMREVVDAVSHEIGADRVGIRLSPTNTTWGINDSHYRETFTTAVKQLDGFGLAYLHLLDPPPEHQHGIETIDYLTPQLRQHWSGNLLVNGGYNKTSGNAALSSGLADAVAFGSPFIANPDLVARYRTDSPLAEMNGDLLYSQGAAGYCDYRSLPTEALLDIA